MDIEVIGIIIIILLCWIVKILNDIRTESRNVSFSLKEDKISYPLEEINKNIEIINYEIQEMKNDISDINYNTDKVRFWTGHRTEDEKFEDLHNINVGNRNEF